MADTPPIIEPVQEGVRLNVGCGQSHFDETVNCDLYPGDAVDVVFDACQSWPFQDNSVKSIYCSHTLEHLPDPFTFFKEAWRVLKPGAVMQLALPFGGHRAAWWDLTHLRPWYPESFCFLQPGYQNGSRNLQHAQWKSWFHIADIAVRISARWAPLLRWKLGRQLALPWLHYLNDVCEELFVYLIALKTPEQVEWWCQNCKDPMLVPARYVMYEHHLTRTRGPTGPGILTPLSVIVLAPAAFHDWGQANPCRVIHQQIRKRGLGYD